MSEQKVKRVAESVVLEFDFSSELSAIDVATMAIAVEGSKPDAAAASVLDGTHQISGKLVYQRISGGVSGVLYHFTCLGTKGLDKIEREGHVLVR
jgi:cobalamin-dependent methionine synthase I